MVEYIVAIDVTRVQFPADAQAPVATLVHKVNEVKRVAEGVITVVKTSTLWSRGGSWEGDWKSPHSLGPRCHACGAALRRVPYYCRTSDAQRFTSLGVTIDTKPSTSLYCISGLVVEYIVAIDVTRVPFPADALNYSGFLGHRAQALLSCLAICLSRSHGHAGD